MSRNSNPPKDIFIDDSDLRTYFNDIEDSGGFSSEVERGLSERIKLDDEEAVQNLVRGNLRFVVSVAKKYTNRGLFLADLIQAGNLGLVTAAKRFDGNKGFKFISYAVWWIRQGILQALAEQSRTVRLPVNKIGELDRLNKIEARLVQTLGRDPTLDELVLESEYEDVGKLEDLRMISQKDASLSLEINDDSRTIFLDSIADDAPLADEDMEIRDRRKTLLLAMGECLNDREYYIIKRYFGLDGAEAQTLEKIGEGIGLTRERVRQIKELVLNKLRAHFTRKGLTVSI